jgi:glycosyltransferase involved in cell wall biosynthesis
MPSSPPRRPITVLQIIPTLVTGGAERTTIDIAAALVSRGDRALVASEGGRLVDELKAAGGAFVRMPVSWKNPAAIAANARRIAALVRREGVDIVHARSRAPAWSAFLACRSTGVPFVTTYHGAYGEKGALKRLYNSVMARGDAVIANSRYTAALIRSRYGTPAERITIIERGVDLRRFDPANVDPVRRNLLRQEWGIGRERRIVLNLARLTGWKGQRVLIEAAALPPLRGVESLAIVLAGDDQGRKGYRQELEGLITERGLSDRVLVVGHCDDAPAALALADAAVVASTEPEAFGRAALEAEAMGVPVVVTDLGAAPATVLAPPEVEPAARTGWRVPPSDPHALAATLAEALALSGPERHALAIRARAQAERFSVEAMQAATLALYDRLLSRASHKNRPDGPAVPGVS